MWNKQIPLEALIDSWNTYRYISIMQLEDGREK
jgi:hypothetical protein